MKKNVKDSDCVYMVETIIGYLDMDMKDRAIDHLRILQRRFVDLSDYGKLAPQKK